MSADQFLEKLQQHAESFARAVADNEGAWLVKGFIDLHQRIYTISVDTKLISKVLELLLFPMFVAFAEKNGFTIGLSPQQNFYPDLTFQHTASTTRYAVDVKSTYRRTAEDANGMTLGAFTGYFRDRQSNKNTLHPYGSYAGHFVLGVLYSKSNEYIDERKVYDLADLATIPSVIREFQFFAQPKYRIANSRPGSGNTKNIGSATKIADLVGGLGPFAELGEAVYDDYWMYYLTLDMAKAVESPRPYTNIKSYWEHKKKAGLNLRPEAIAKAEAAEQDQGLVSEDSE